MNDNIMHYCDKEKDLSKDMIFEVTKEDSDEVGYLNIDSSDEEELLSAAASISSAFAYTIHSDVLLNCKAEEIFLERDGFNVKRLG